MSSSRFGKRGGLGRRLLERWAAERIAVREQVDVAIELSLIAKREDAQVPQTNRHPSREEPDEPAEDPDDVKSAAERSCDQGRGEREDQSEAGLPAILTF